MSYPTTEEILTEQSAGESVPEGQPETGDPQEGSNVEASREIQQGQQPANGKTNAAGETWDGSKWQLKYRDQTIIPKDRDHLVNLAQQGFSYSQRMEELKNREKQIETQSGKYAQYEKLEKAFESNPQFRDQVYKWYDQSFTPAQKQAAETTTQQQAGGNIPPELLQEIASLKEFKAQFEAQQEQQAVAKADEQVISEIDDLKKQFPRDDWDSQASNGMTLTQEIIKHALDNGGMKLKTAYKDLMWDQHVKTTEAETLKKSAENKKASAKAGIVAGGKSKGAVAPTEPDPASMGSYNDIEKHVRQLYNIS
jgi:hypothetical protein